MIAPSVLVRSVACIGVGFFAMHAAVAAVPGPVEVARFEVLREPVRLPDGSILAVGIRLRNGIQEVDARVSRDEGTFWSAPRPLFRLPREAGGFGFYATFVDRRGEIHLFFLCDGNTGSALPVKDKPATQVLDIWQVRSTASATAWELPRRIWGGRAGDLLSVVQLPGGRIILPISFQTNRSSGSASQSAAAHAWRLRRRLSLSRAHRERKSDLHPGRFFGDAFAMAGGSRRAAARRAAVRCALRPGLAGRNNPEYGLLTRTGRLVYFRLEGGGADRIPHPDKTNSQVLRIFKPDGQWPSGAVWNFPAGPKGSMRLRVLLKAGSAGLLLGLTDHFSVPWDQEDRFHNIFNLDVQPGSGLETSRWHDVELDWNCDKGECRIKIDGHARRILSRKREPQSHGICYLRLRPAAPVADTAGALVESVSVKVSPRRAR